MADFAAPQLGSRDFSFVGAESWCSTVGIGGPAVGAIDSPGTGAGSAEAEATVA